MLACMMLAIMPAMAQSVVDPTTVVDHANPLSFVTQSAVDALTVALTVILAFFSGAIPALKNINAGFLRALASGIIIVAGTATFKFGFLNQESVDFVFKSFLPNFAYSGLIWEAIKFAFKLAGVELKNYTPNTTTTGA